MSESVQAVVCVLTCTLAQLELAISQQQAREGAICGTWALLAEKHLMG